MGWEGWWVLVTLFVIVGSMYEYLALSFELWT